MELLRAAELVSQPVFRRMFAMERITRWLSDISGKGSGSPCAVSGLWLLYATAVGFSL